MSTIHHSRAVVREHQHMAPDYVGDELVGLPEAARRLGLHRATVNEMVHDGRLTGHRLGPHWFVRRAELEDFAARYERPKNSPRRRGPGEAARFWREQLLRRLGEWHDATVDELERVIDLVPGNIRKYLNSLEHDDLARRDETGSWTLTERGRSELRRMQAYPPAGGAPELEAV